MPGQKLKEQLARLYGRPGCAVVIAFDQQSGHDGSAAWSALCLLANALQTELGWPAPAVSISGVHGYRLWLSFEAAVAPEPLLALLQQAYVPDTPLRHDAQALLELPPCLHPATGRWAAFINPGLGASFSEEFGLEMAPPLAAQAALLHEVRSIGRDQLDAALAALQPGAAAAPAALVHGLGVLLKDATLEQIVAHLHGLNIEPTFRHLLKPGSAS